MGPRTPAAAATPSHRGLPPVQPGERGQDQKADGEGQRGHQAGAGPGAQAPRSSRQEESQGQGQRRPSGRARGHPGQGRPLQPHPGLRLPGGGQQTGQRAPQESHTQEHGAAARTAGESRPPLRSGHVRVVGRRGQWGPRVLGPVQWVPPRQASGALAPPRSPWAAAGGEAGATLSPAPFPHRQRKNGALSIALSPRNAKAILGKGRKAGRMTSKAAGKQVASPPHPTPGAPRPPGS